MNFLLWVVGCWFVTAANAVPLRNLLAAVHFDSFINLLAVVNFDSFAYLPTVARVISFRFLIALTMNDFVERRGGVKTLLVRDAWLIAVDGWLNGVRKALIRVRWPSIRDEHWGRVQGMLRSTFLKRGTFMVSNLNWCCFLKWMFHSSRARRVQRMFAKGGTSSSSFYSLVNRRPKSRNFSIRRYHPQRNRCHQLPT